MTPPKNFSLISLLKNTAKMILIGVILFSIVRNIRGLDLEFAGVSFVWQVLIAVTITLASSVLTGSSIVVQAQNYVRWLLFLCGIMFSTVSFFLSYSGAIADMQGKHLKQITQDPQVVQLNKEIEDVIDRANAYGVSERQKMSLLQREKELRQDLRKARERAILQAQNQSRKEEINVTGIALFAVLPELGIITFTIVIVLLSNQNIPRHETSLVQSTQSEVPNYNLPANQVQTQPTSQFLSNNNNKILSPTQTEGTEKDKNWSPFV